MPKSVEERSDCGPEAPLPQAEARQGGQIIAQPQVPAAKAEGGVEPADRQLCRQEQLGQHRKPPVQGPQGIGGGTHQKSAEQTAQEPLPDKSGIQRHSPLRWRGSS